MQRYEDMDRLALEPQKSHLRYLHDTRPVNPDKGLPPTEFY